MRAHGISKSFGGQAVLRGADLELHQGEIVLLKGENASGKTTLVNILTGNLEPDRGEIHLDMDGTAERFCFPRSWWQEINPLDHFTPERVATECVGRTWQDVRLFSTGSLRDNVAVAKPKQSGENPLFSLFRPLSSLRRDVQNTTEADKVLAKLGLEGRQQSSADRISLGQSKRVAIARAVRAGAKVLFLDEPLAGLDEPGIEQILSLLRELVTANGITLVIIEHVLHIPRLLDLVSTVWTLKSGKITVNRPDEVRAELRNNPQNDMPTWLRDLAQRTGRKISVSALPGGAIWTVASSPDQSSTAPILEVRDLVVRRGRRDVIGSSAGGEVIGLSLALNHGDLAVLEAPNGWGKTTLLEAIAGLLPAVKGDIRLGGHSILRTPPWRRTRMGISLLQSRSVGFPQLTAGETLNLASTIKIPKHLEPLRNRAVCDLSGGEKQRLAFAAAAGAHDPKAYILDEPFAALDDRSTEDIRRNLEVLLGKCAILVAVPGASSQPKGI